MLFNDECSYARLAKFQGRQEPDGTGPDDDDGVLGFHICGKMQDVGEVRVTNSQLSKFFSSSNLRVVLQVEWLVLNPRVSIGFLGGLGDGRLMAGSLWRWGKLTVGLRVLHPCTVYSGGTNGG